MNHSRITTSKFLSKHLRHAPQDIGLTLEPGGWVGVDDLLAACEKAQFAITYDDLLEVVETCDKQRFSFDESGDRIRANQGHSTPVDLQLESASPPDVLYHGTVEKFLAAILAEGLKKGKRHHVHLSKDQATALKVGARRGKPIILEVDARAMASQGIPFFVSANGVWLTDAVPKEFLKRM